MYQRNLKRPLDVVLAGLALIILSPVLILTTMAIRVADGSPVIYRQSRPGRGGAPFTLLKFRSMPVATESVPSAGMTSVTVTRIGRVIRRLNVDELPQLLNILRGDMSVVGPRPCLPSQEVLIHLRAQGPAWNVRPGLTGWAQVNAFDGMSEEQKAGYDNEYAHHITLRRDVAIIGRSVLYLLKPPPTY